jgi:hypothetical protein
MSSVMALSSTLVFSGIFDMVLQPFIRSPFIFGLLSFVFLQLLNLILGRRQPSFIELLTKFRRSIGSKSMKEYAPEGIWAGLNVFLILMIAFMFFFLHLVVDGWQWGILVLLTAWEVWQNPLKLEEQKISSKKEE